MKTKRRKLNNKFKEEQTFVNVLCSVNLSAHSHLSADSVATLHDLHMFALNNTATETRGHYHTEGQLWLVLCSASYAAYWGAFYCRYKLITVSRLILTIQTALYLSAISHSVYVLTRMKSMMFDTIHGFKYYVSLGDVCCAQVIHLVHVQHTRCVFTVHCFH